MTVKELQKMLDVADYADTVFIEMPDGTRAELKDVYADIEKHDDGSQGRLITILTATSL